MGPSFAAAAAVFTVAAATDFLDGYLARRWHRTSDLGVFLDTTADKMLVAGALIALVAVGHASAWAAAVIVWRELAVLGLKAAAATSERRRQQEPVLERRVSDGHGGGGGGHRAVGLELPQEPPVTA